MNFHWINICVLQLLVTLSTHAYQFIPAERSIIKHNGTTRTIARYYLRPDKDPKKPGSLTDKEQFAKFLKEFKSDDEDQNSGGKKKIERFKIHIKRKFKYSKPAVPFPDSIPIETTTTEASTQSSIILILNDVNGTVNHQYDKSVDDVVTTKVRTETYNITRPVYTTPVPLPNDGESREATNVTSKKLFLKESATMPLVVEETVVEEHNKNKTDDNSIENQRVPYIKTNVSGQFYKPQIDPHNNMYAFWKKKQQKGQKHEPKADANTEEDAEFLKLIQFVEELEKSSSEDFNDQILASSSQAFNNSGRSNLHLKPDRMSNTGISVNINEKPKHQRNRLQQNFGDLNGYDNIIHDHVDSSETIQSRNALGHTGRSEIIQSENIQRSVRLQPDPKHVKQQQKIKHKLRGGPRVNEWNDDDDGDASLRTKSTSLRTNSKSDASANAINLKPHKNYNNLTQQEINNLSKLCSECFKRIYTELLQQRDGDSSGSKEQSILQLFINSALFSYLQSQNHNQQSSGTLQFPQNNPTKTDAQVSNQLSQPDITIKNQDLFIENSEDDNSKPNAISTNYIYNKNIVNSTGQINQEDTSSKTGQIDPEQSNTSLLHKIQGQTYILPSAYNPQKNISLGQTNIISRYSTREHANSPSSHDILHNHEETDSVTEKNYTEYLNSVSKLIYSPSSHVKQYNKLNESFNIKDNNQTHSLNGKINQEIIVNSDGNNLQSYPLPGNISRKEAQLSSRIKYLKQIDADSDNNNLGRPYFSSVHIGIEPNNQTFNSKERPYSGNVIHQHSNSDYSDPLPFDYVSKEQAYQPYYNLLGQDYSPTDQEQKITTGNKTLQKENSPSEHIILVDSRNGNTSKKRTNKPFINNKERPLSSESINQKQITIIVPGLKNLVKDYSPDGLFTKEQKYLATVNNIASNYSNLGEYSSSRIPEELTYSPTESVIGQQINTVLNYSSLEPSDYIIQEYTYTPTDNINQENINTVYSQGDVEQEYSPKVKVININQHNYKPFSSKYRQHTEKRKNQDDITKGSGYITQHIYKPFSNKDQTHSTTGNMNQEETNADSSYSSQAQIKTPHTYTNEKHTYVPSDNINQKQIHTSSAGIVQKRTKRPSSKAHEEHIYSSSSYVNQGEESGQNSQEDINTSKGTDENLKRIIQIISSDHEIESEEQVPNNYLFKVTYLKNILAKLKEYLKQNKNVYMSNFYKIIKLTFTVLSSQLDEPDVLVKHSWYNKLNPVVKRRIKNYVYYLLREPWMQEIMNQLHKNNENLSVIRDPKWTSYLSSWVIPVQVYNENKTNNPDQDDLINIPSDADKILSDIKLHVHSFPFNPTVGTKEYYRKLTEILRRVAKHLIRKGYRKDEILTLIRRIYRALTRSIKKVYTPCSRRQKF